MTHEIAPKLKTNLQTRIDSIALSTGLRVDEVMKTYTRLTSYSGYSWHALTREQKDFLMLQLLDECKDQDSEYNEYDE